MDAQKTTINALRILSAEAIEKAKKSNQEEYVYFVRYVRPDVGCKVNFNCKDN